jgi:pimeloyl-ACP methyl ester carboxylesterase
VRKAASIVACLAVCVSALALVHPAAAPAAERSAPRAQPANRVPAYTPPPLRWHGCRDATLRRVGSQCADLVVPLDYRRPSGRKITLAVSRLRHSSPDAAYQGVMLVNPGGPGGSGLVYSYLGAGRYIPGDGDTTYDWIGFDPRGVGSSRPVLSCNPRYFGYDRPGQVPVTRALERVWLRRSAGYAAACKRSSGAALLGHVRTTDSVADLESLRKALGRSTINLYGFSYGTYLGQVYATLHPDRVRRFVWDGNVDPRRVSYLGNLDQDRAFQRTINVYFGWLAKHHDVYGLGRTQRQVAAGFYRERRLLDRRPAGGVVGPAELTDVMASAAYYVYDWVEIGRDYAALVRRGDHRGIRDRYRDANPTSAGGDNGYAMYLATQCTDSPWPRSWARIRRDNWRTHRVAPFMTWNNAWFNGPCSFWPVRARRPVQVSGARVRSSILLVNETLDPATPYPGALELRRRFPTASLVEGVGGTTHSGSLSGVACTDEAIGRYLTDGTVPARVPGNRSDLRCPPVPQPDPQAPSSARQRLLPHLRPFAGMPGAARALAPS